MDQAGYDAIAAEELAAIMEAGQALIAEYSGPASTEAGANGGTVHTVIAGTGGDEMELLQFLPNEVQIAAGDTVRWENLSPNAEPHTVTFLGGEAPPEFVLVEGGEAGPPTFVQNPLVSNPTEATTFSGTGYINSGILASDLPTTTYELTFDTPGTYSYYCQFHGGPELPEGATPTPGAEIPLGGMVGTVVVT
ncbi:MAG: plastocyanin/azurin family copper-binding protein [Chloroflexota bacterium]|nr:plastocyanin/azurin family copper-binding protein [Chloroflexota bacterium]